VKLSRTSRGLSLPSSAPWLRVAAAGADDLRAAAGRFAAAGPAVADAWRALPFAAVLRAALTTADRAFAVLAAPSPPALAGLAAGFAALFGVALAAGFKDLAAAGFGCAAFAAGLAAGAARLAAAAALPAALPLDLVVPPAAARFAGAADAVLAAGAALLARLAGAFAGASSAIATFAGDFLTAALAVADLAICYSIV
jgi:hypothetical protein